MNQLLKSRLGVMPLVATLFFLVSGGPFGLEDLLQKCGIFGSIGVLLATPLLWSLPTALLVGELGAALPEEGGYYAWVRRALGPFWGFQEAWLSIAASLFDMAIYPTLFVSYLGRLVPALGHGPWSSVLCVLFVGAGAVWNFRGAVSVARGAELQTLLVIAPFLLISALAFAHPAPSAEAPGGLDPLGGILVAMWNFMGWDNASTFAKDVYEPQRTYPRAVLLAVLAVTICYLVPVIAIGVAGVDVSSWTAGSWATYAGERGGPALMVIVVIAGAVSSFSMFNALTLSYSRLPVALARDGYLPAIFERTTGKHNAPWVAIVACALLWTLSLGLPFDRLVMLDILLYGLSLILELVSLVVLRVREPDLPRPYRVPGGVAACVALAIAPTALIVMSVVRNRDERLESGMSALTLGAMLIAAGPILYGIATSVRRRRAS